VAQHRHLAVVLLYVSTRVAQHRHLAVVLLYVSTRVAQHRHLLQTPVPPHTVPLPDSL
jgi:hypothetical protein